MALSNAERQARFRARQKEAAKPRGAKRAPKAGPAPFTVPHFRAWCRRLELDNGEQMETEPFQEAFAEDLFSGTPECWLIIPEGNGKTTLFAALALYHIEHRRSAMVPVAASARDQAQIMYQQAEGFILRSELDGFKLHPGYRRIKHGDMLSAVQFQAADDRTGDGVIPTLALLDELHRHRDLRLYRTWRGKLLKRNGQIGAISTRGEPDSEFERTIAQIRAEATDVSTDGGFTRAASTRFILHEWAVPDGSDIRDMRVVKAANPLRSITAEALGEKFAAPTMTLHHWNRFVCNRPTRDDDVWLGPDGEAWWKACEDPHEFVPGAPTWMGLDLAIVRDTAAAVTMQRRPDGRLHAKLRVWTPQPDKPIDLTDVMQHVREQGKRYDLQAVSFDPRFFDVAAKMLSDEGYPMDEVPQSVERMSPACGALYEGIQRAQVTHDGDPVLAAHVLTAVPRFNERGFTLAKGKSRGKIDGCIALVLAYDEAVHFAPKPRTPLFIGTV